MSEKKKNAGKSNVGQSLQSVIPYKMVQTAIKLFAREELNYTCLMVNFKAIIISNVLLAAADETTNSILDHCLPCLEILIEAQV